jgi:hypothetical protein
VLKAANSALNATVMMKDLSERNRREIKCIGFKEDKFPFEAESWPHMINDDFFIEGDLIGSPLVSICINPLRERCVWD